MLDVYKTTGTAATRKPIRHIKRQSIQVAGGPGPTGDAHQAPSIQSHKMLSEIGPIKETRRSPLLAAVKVYY